jgi:regulatory protein
VVITRIVKRKNKRRMFAVHVDGSYAFDVSDTVLVQYGLKTEDNIDQNKIAEIKASEVRKEAQLTAVNYLSYRPRSSREVIDHLGRKGFPRDLAESIVRHFETVSLINNLEFARMFVRDKLRRKPIGKSLIQKLLAAKGISSPMIQQVLSENISDEDQKNAALELASRRLRLTKRSMAKLDPIKQRQRLTGYLLRHGFTNEVVQKTVQTLFRT